MGGCHIARAIRSEIVEPERVTYRDNQRYFNVLLEKNSRRNIYRFHFNSSSKKANLFELGEERRVEVQSVTDLYQYPSELKAAYQKMHKVGASACSGL